jgi:hypothetical protein
MSDDYEHSEWKKRRLAPIAVLVVGFLVLFSVTFLVVRSKSLVESIPAFSPDNSLVKLSIPTGDKLYRFQLKQVFSEKDIGVFSELEVELLDQNYNHVYSVYKDLWQERHHDGEAYQIYKDLAINFELELPEAGTYYLRTISHNNIPFPVQGVYYKKTSGSLYYMYYMWLCLGLLVIMLLGQKIWGTPKQIVQALSKIRSVRKNKLFWGTAICFATFYIGCLVISIGHYGYAAAGDKVIVPTTLIDKENVIYIG